MLEKFARLKQGEALESLLAEATNNGGEGEQQHKEVSLKAEIVEEEVKEEAEADSTEGA